MYGAYPQLLAPPLVTPLPPSGNIHNCDLFNFDNKKKNEHLMFSLSSDMKNSLL